MQPRRGARCARCHIAHYSPRVLFASRFRPRHKTRLREPVPWRAPANVPQMPRGPHVRKKVVKGRFVQRPHGGILLWTPHAKSACNRWMLTATAYPLKEAGEALMYGAGFQQPRWFRRRVDQPQEQTRDLSRLLGHHPRQLPRRHRPPPHRARSPS